MEYSSEKREKTSISVRPSIWERFDQERLRRGYSTAANALEVALADWMAESGRVDVSDKEAHNQLDDLLASPEADAVRDMLAWIACRHDAQAQIACSENRTKFMTVSIIFWLTIRVNSQQNRVSGEYLREIRHNPKTGSVRSFAGSICCWWSRLY